MWAKLRGGAQRHRGVNAERARLIARGGDDTALVGAATDDDGLAAQIGALEQFDGDVKRVHVEMQDGRGIACGRAGSIAWLGVLCAKSGQLWHGRSVSNGGYYADDSGEVLLCADASPAARGIEQIADSFKLIDAEFENEQSAGRESCGCLRDERRI